MDSIEDLTTVVVLGYIVIIAVDTFKKTKKLTEGISI